MKLVKFLFVLFICLSTISNGIMPSCYVSAVQHTHSYSNDCDKYCNTCYDYRLISHRYITTLNKATTSKSGQKKTKCIVCGAVSELQTIPRIKTIKLEKDSYTYNGKRVTPTVKVVNQKGKKLKVDVDYSVSYAAGRTAIGKYKVTVKFKGDLYSGSKTLTFQIRPRTASIKKLTTEPNEIKVKINRCLKQSTGYQIEYGIQKDFKGAKRVYVKNYLTSLKTLRSLKPNTVYYVRIRTYKQLADGKCYSNWSSAKKIRVK